jgi:hypothetical protein
VDEAKLRFVAICVRFYPPEGVRILFSASNPSSFSRFRESKAASEFDLCPLDLAIGGCLTRADFVWVVRPLPGFSAAGACAVGCLAVCGERPGVAAVAD